MWNRIKARLLRVYYRWLNRRAWAGHYTDAPVSNLQISGPAAALPLRIYASKATGQLPVILYLHGGGWVIGDLESHHPFCQVLAEASGATVVALDYRLGPEHPYPAAHEDSRAAAEWLAKNLDAVGPNNGSMVIAGDSAGGNLAAATCLALGQAAREKLSGAIALYPAVDHYTRSQPSHAERAKAKPLTMNIMTWFWDSFLADTAPDAAPLARPLLSTQLHTLPPLYSVSAEYDVLRDEGKAFAEAVAATGVAVEHHHYADAAHGFACSAGRSRDFDLNLERMVVWLQSLG